MHMIMLVFKIIHNIFQWNHQTSSYYYLILIIIGYLGIFCLNNDVNLNFYSQSNFVHFQQTSYQEATHNWIISQ